MKIEADDILKAIADHIKKAEELKADSKGELGIAFLNGYIMGVNHIKDVVEATNEGEMALEEIKKTLEGGTNGN